MFPNYIQVSHLSPQEGAKAQENTPQPLLNGQTHTTERFTTKLHNDDLQKAKGIYLSFDIVNLTRCDNYLAPHRLPV